MWISESEASLVYRMSSRIVRFTQRNTVSKERKKGRKEERKEERKGRKKTPPKQKVLTFECQVDKGWACYG